LAEGNVFHPWRPLPLQLLSVLSIYQISYWRTRVKKIATFPDRHDAFASDPALWAIGLTARQLIPRMKSLLLAMLFDAPGLYLGQGSLVRGAKYMSFGRGVSAHSNLWLEAVPRYGDQRSHPVIEIGDDVSFADGVHISCVERIVIKRHALIGSRVYISDSSHGLYKGLHQSRPDEPPARRKLGIGGPVVIGENVWIGANVVIVGPVTIGDAAVIGANSVIRRNVPPGTMVAGVPAVPVKEFRQATECWEIV
jgi:lipopolysaccharide O-acetyltransferase